MAPFNICIVDPGSIPTQQMSTASADAIPIHENIRPNKKGLIARIGTSIKESNVAKFFFT